MSFSDRDSDSDAVMIDHDDISNYNPDNILPQPPETIAKIRDWLQPTSYDVVGSEYRKHLNAHLDGTGAWLTASTTYQEWLQNSKHGLLWIKGIPGSGKSVLAASLIYELSKSRPGVPVLFFFFRQIIAANHEPQALLRDWMHQLLDYSPPLQSQLKEHMDEDHSVESLPVKDMWNTLRMAFHNLPGEVFCVADALDEMDGGNEPFLDALGAVGSWNPAKVKILITSRPVPSVEEPLRRASGVHLRLQERLVDADISMFVRAALSSSEIPQDRWDVITDAVPGQANGLFLYARLAMDAFLEPGADIDSVLSKLPTDLNVMYTELLREHAQRSKVSTEIQDLILQAVTHTTRPLRLIELAEMIRHINPDASTRDMKATKDVVRTACGPLLEILADETVSVVHHSFTEYLRGTTRQSNSTGYPILESGSTNARLALACLQYMQAGCLSEVQIRSDDETKMKDSKRSKCLNRGFPARQVTPEDAQFKLRHAFFDYAADNWHRHIVRAENAGYDQTHMISELGNFLNNDQNLRAWLQKKWPGTFMSLGCVTKVHVAAKTGLVSYIKALIDKTKMDNPDACGKTPIWWAACEGHAGAIRELIAAGADPNRYEGLRGLRPLHIAAERNNYEAVKALLDAGVDPMTKKALEPPGRWCWNARSTLNDTPLMYACQRGHLESLKVFLPFLADVKTVHRALGWAAEAGELKLVSEILQHPGVNVNNTDHNHVTPLYLATGAPANGHLIKYLLDAGADASFSIDYPPGSILSSRCKKVAGRSYTCMHQLCNSRDRSDSSEDGCDDLETIFRLLVDAGVSIQQPTPSGDTPLHGALSSRILTRLLIDAGANPNAKNDQGKSPLDICRSPELLTILFESSEMDINAVRGSGRTLLQEKLLSCGNDTIFKLLEYRPDCTITDREGNGVLHAALSCCLTVPKIIEALLENGADPNLRNQQGQAPAHLLVQSKSSNWLCILDLLLKAGADINATDRQGLSIFFQFIAKKTFSNFRSNPHQDLQNLLDRGASPTIRDLAGRTCLHVAIEHNNDSSRMRSDKSDSRFDFLVGLGLDIFSLDHRGNGLLHELAVFKTDYEPTNNRMLMERWKQLVDSGLDINQKNYYARTPLHLLCSSVTERTLARRGELMVIDFVIERTADINACDLDGLTPLHMAVTKSEFYTKRLLDAGANPAALAHNGMTPLHLACDAEKSNIVGILLDALRNCNTSDLLCEEVRGTSSEIGKVSSSQSLRRQKSVPGINARIYEGEAVGYTPLFLACRSGKPETVALLLEAGASVVLSDDSQACGIPLYLVADTSLIDACRAFEGLENSRNYHHIWTCENVLSGTAAPCKRRRMPSDSYGFTESHTRRIDEIMDMIIRNGADLSYFGSNRDGVLQALAGENSYASRCFGTAVQNNRDVLASGEELERIIQMFKLQSTAAPSIKSLEDLGCLKPGESNEDLFRKLMVRKEYQLVEKLAELGADFLAGPNSSSSNFGILVRHGFASLVEKIGSLESKRNHGKGKWHAFGDPTKPGLWLAERDLTHSLRTGESLTPFIVDAVRRRSPSIRLLRCLVEVLAVDINEMCYKAISVDSERKMVSEETPLLAAASGTVWWHVYQALPYLLKAGADMSIRNMYGHSALHVALLSDGIWSDEAAKALIEAGADVNALDNVGRSCLASVQHNVGLIKLLVQHGAIVTAEAVFAAIESGNIEALEALLSTGVNADIRRHHTYDPEDEDDVIIRGVEEQGLSIYSDAAEARGQTPLHFAALKAAPQKQPQMVRVLLDHGADPLATFLKRSNRDKYSSSVLEGYKERIVWHDLLLQGASALPLSCLTSLDVNRRDAKGRTLLHVACESKEGPDHCIELSEVTNSDDKTTIFKHLLSLGADINAIDKRGRNVIHFMMCCRLWAKYEVIKDSLAWTINTVPDLMHQADIDGMRPLHHAIIRATVKEGTDTIRVLLDRGADPRPTTNEGRSCLHLLAMVLHQASMLELFGDLVKQGVDVNGRDKDGRTPVFFFYRRSWKPNSRRLASELIRDPSGVRLPTNKTFTEKDFVTNFKNLGVDFFVKDNKGQGLLHIAAATGQFEPFKELMDLGLDVMMEDNDQRTPIDIAATYGNHEVMRLFDKTR